MLYFCVEQRCIIIEESCLSRDHVNAGSGPRSGDVVIDKRFFGFESEQRGRAYVAFFVFTRVLLYAQRDGAMKGSGRTKSTKAISESEQWPPTLRTLFPL